MAELVMRVRAEYESAIACRQELKKVEEQIKNLDNSASPKEIERLLKKHAELSSRWENNMSSFGKYSAYAQEAFEKIGKVFRSDTKEMSGMTSASETVLSTAQKRLVLEERIQETLKKQKTEAENQRSYLQNGYARNFSALQELEERLKKKNNYKGEGFYSEADKAILEDARKHVENWAVALDKVNVQIRDYEKQIELSNSRAEEHREILMDIKAPNLDLKGNIDNLTSEITRGEESVNKLKEDLVDLKREFDERQTPQGASKYYQDEKDKMYSLFGNIEDKKKEIEDLQNVVDSFSFSGLLSQQQQLESNADNLTEKIRYEDEVIANLKEQQQGLNEQTAIYQRIQNEIDFHSSERERYLQNLNNTNDAIKTSQESINEEVKAQAERQQKIKELKGEIEGLKELYEKQKEIVNDPSSNQKAIENLQKEISKREEQIDVLERSNAAMQDVLERARDSYYSDNAKQAISDIKTLDEEFMNANSDIREFGKAIEESVKQEALENQKMRIGELSQKMQQLVDKAKELAAQKEIQLEIITKKSNEQALDSGNAEKYQEEIDKANKSIENINEQLSENAKEYVALKQEQEEYTHLVEEAEGGHIRLRTQIMNAREELARMIEEGKQGTPEFAEAAKQAGDLRQQMQLSSAAMEYFGSENRHLETLKDSLQGVAGGFSLVTGVMGVFNKDAAEMEKIQTKIQSSLGIIIGLESTYAKVKNTSNIMMAIGEVQSWASAKAAAAEAAAKEAGTIATMKATVAQAAFNMVAKANPYVLLASAILTLVGGIYILTKAFGDENDAEKKAIEQKKEHIRIIREQQKQWSDSVASSASKQISSYRQLQDKWNELGNDMTKKRKFIKDNQSEFRGLGIAVNSVSDAENLFVKNTDAVINAITARAKAAAYQTLIQEELERQIRAESYKTANTGNFKYTVNAGTKAKTGKDVAYSQAQKGGYVYQEGDIDKEGNWTKAGAKRINDATEKASQKAKQEHQKEIAAMKKRSQDRIKTYQDNAKKEAEAAKKTMKDAGFKEYENKKTGGSGKSKAEQEEQRKSLMDKQERDRIRLAKDIEFSTRQAQIDAMEEGTEKVLKKINLDHDREIEAIRRSYEDMRLKRVEEAKKLWENEPKNKGKNFYDSDEYQNALKSPMRKTLSKDNDALMGVKETERKILSELGKGDIMNAIQEQFGKGNVDILARPLVDTIELAKKGWKDVGEGYATVFSSGYGIKDKEGNVREILVTPILPDGTVLSEKELEDYIFNVLEGSEDILKADDKGIVIAVDVDKEAGDKLHILQEQLYDIPNEKTIEIKALYDNVTDAEIENMNARIQAADAKTARERLNLQKQQIESIKEYFDKYGSMSQQQYAIDEYYAIRRKEAQGDQYKLMTLDREQRNAKEMLNVNAITNGIDWKAMLQGVGSMSREMIEPMLRQLQAYTKTDGFRKNLDGNQQRDVINLINEMRQFVKEDKGEMDSLANSIMLFNNSLAEYKNLEAQAEAKRLELEEAQKTPENETEEQRKQRDERVAQLTTEFQALGEQAATAKDNMQHLADNVNSASDAVMNMAGGMTVALNNLTTWKNVDGFSGLQQGSQQMDTWANTAFMEAQERLAQEIEKAIASDLEKAKEKESLDEKLNNGDLTNEQYQQQLMQAFGSSNTQLLNGMSNVMTNMSNGMGNMLNSVMGEGLGSLVGMIAQIPKMILQMADFFKNFVTGILDSFTELFKFDWLSDMVNSILDAFGNLIEAIFELPANLFKAIGSIITKGIGGLLEKVTNVISFGLFSGGESDENYESDMEKLSASNDRLTKAIDQLTKTMKDGTYSDIEEYYDRQMLAMGQLQKNAAEQLRRSLEAWKSGGLFHSDDPSTAAMMAERLSEKQIMTIMKYAGIEPTTELASSVFRNTFSSSGVLLGQILGGMSTEQMYNLKTYEPELWQDLLTYSSYGYKDASEYLAYYGELYEKEQELLRNKLEEINKISFDELKNSFLDALKSMEDDAGDTAENIAKIMSDALIEDNYNKNWKDKIEKWYERLADVLQMTNEKDRERELTALRKEYQGYMDQARKEAEEIKDMTGYTEVYKKAEQQSATSNSAKSITYEQADALAGIGTAQLMVQEQIKAILDRWDMNRDNPDAAESAAREMAGVMQSARPKTDGFEKAVRAILDRSMMSRVSVDEVMAEIGSILHELQDDGYDVPVPQEGEYIPDNTESDTSFLEVTFMQLMAVGVEQRDIAADSRDILAGMAIHVEEIRDGVVDTIVPRIKSIDDNLNRVYKIVEEQ